MQQAAQFWRVCVRVVLCQRNGVYTMMCELKISAVYFVTWCKYCIKRKLLLFPLNFFCLDQFFPSAFCLSLLYICFNFAPKNVIVLICNLIFFVLASQNLLISHFINCRLSRITSNYWTTFQLCLGVLWCC